MYGWGPSPPPPAKKAITANDLSQGVLAAYLSSEVYNYEDGVRDGDDATSIAAMPCLGKDVVKTAITGPRECTDLTTYIDKDTSAFGFTAALGSKMVVAFAGSGKTKDDLK